MSLCCSPERQRNQAVTSGGGREAAPCSLIPSTQPIIAGANRRRWISHTHTHTHTISLTTACGKSSLKSWLHFNFFPDMHLKDQFAQTGEFSPFLELHGRNRVLQPWKHKMAPHTHTHTSSTALTVDCSSLCFWNWKWSEDDVLFVQRVHHSLLFSSVRGCI